MGQTMRTPSAEGSPALSRRPEPGDHHSWTGCQPHRDTGAVPHHCCAQGNVLLCQELANTLCSQVFPLEVPQENTCCLLEMQGVGRAALQDALDVLLKGMLRLGHDAQRGHRQVLVLSGAQQGRGGRVHSASRTQQHREEHSQSTQTETASELKLVLQVRNSSTVEFLCYCRGF